MEAALTTELVADQFNRNGFKSFEANGEKWWPKSASSKVNKHGKVVLSLTWTTLHGEHFADAAYRFARVYVDPDTHELIKAQVRT